jgi:hypothetical protein
VVPERNKRDSMYDELLISGFPSSLLFDTFFVEEIERLQRMAQATPVYPSSRPRARSQRLPSGMNYEFILFLPHTIREGGDCVWQCIL